MFGVNTVDLCAFILFPTEFGYFMRHISAINIV